MVDESNENIRRLRPLIDNYAELLSTSIENDKLAHHLRHVAPESWLCLKLAYLVNHSGPSLQLSGWFAKLEQKRVDVTLISPAGVEVGSINLEFKLIPTHYWTNWNEVYRDLGYGVPSEHLKPKANFAVCLLEHRVDKPLTLQSSHAQEKRRGKFDSIPANAELFSPINSSWGPLKLCARSSNFNLSWKHHAHESPSESVASILWVSRP